MTEPPKKRTGNNENVPVLTTGEEKILGITGKITSRGLDVPETITRPLLETSPIHQLLAQQYLPHHSSPPPTQSTSRTRSSRKRSAKDLGQIYEACSGSSTAALTAIAKHLESRNAIEEKRNLIESERNIILKERNRLLES
ncbi:unnamed protein product [Danaus chrysippus]|uniref:(African queen) hypothetical protein n=1 Tax=Danaus chrysippus TaxID=151541 RepID=A0A8J2QII1_9NEOP|nr:unnamed protein product [Danaus chrysippus]CAG9563662.1 unnamed protein product [Danaus chrysippus]